MSCHGWLQVQITTMAYYRGRARKSGTCDSEAERDQSAASRNKDISEHFDRLAVSKCEDKQETAYGNDTPKQKSDSSDAKPNLDTNQSRVSQHKDEQWLKEHPWENETPRR